MNLILALFFRTPFWVQFALAAGLVWFGFTVQQDETNRQAARAALLEQAPPATIPISAATPGEPSRIPVELSVTAQVATDHNTRLVQKTNFIQTGESLLYVLVDPAPGGDPNRAEAAMIIDPDDLDAFAEWLAGNSTDFGEVGPIATINGLLAMPSDRSQAQKAMKEQGMIIPDDFFFVEPFFNGREASLAAIPNSAAQISWPIFGAAAIMALIGAMKLRRGSRPQVAKADPIPAARPLGAYTEAELTAGRMLPAATKSAKPAKPAVAKSKLIVWSLGLVLLAGFFSGQNWAYAIMPLAFFGLVFLGLRNGVRTFTQAVGSVVENVTTKPASAPNPALGATPASEIGATTALAAPAGGGPIRSGNSAFMSTNVRKDDGPIRPGFSFKDLLPQSKRKSVATSDPYERLAQQRRQDSSAPTRR